jgi:hypothetical protein
MEAARSSETLVNFYQTTWRYNQENSHLLISLGLIPSKGDFSPFATTIIIMHQNTNENLSAASLQPSWQYRTFININILVFLS